MIGVLSAGALSLAAAATPSMAQDERPYEAAAGELRIVHVWTTEPEAFLKAWTQPTPPELNTATSTKRNRPIQQFILYANCTRNAAGQCHLTARVAITAPDGTPYGEEMAFEALPLGEGVPAGHIGMAPRSIGLVIEDGEQLGTYRVQLAVTDEIAAVTATHTARIEVSEAP